MRDSRGLGPSVIAAVTFSVFIGTTAQALSLQQFAGICDSAKVPCSEIPILQGYVGGALDMIAMLDEETDYLQPIYCKPPSEFFNVPEIIRYIMRHKEQTGTTELNKNTMLVVIRYLEQRGGCPGQ